MMEWLKSLFGGKKNEETTEPQNTESEVETTETESSNEEQAQ
jgi:SepF-like predicted cell division protein (DUF552 family)